MFLTIGTTIYVSNPMYCSSWLQAAHILSLKILCQYVSPNPRIHPQTAAQLAVHGCHHACFDLVTQLTSP